MLEHLDESATPGMFAAGDRVLVAVSEQPGADTVIRSAKRLADALRAPWQAVFIETPRAAGFGEPEKMRVADTLRLAATLGATIATVPAENVRDGLRTYLTGMRATHLVLGKSARSWWFELRHGSIVDAMLKSGDGLAVHVIPAEAGTPASVTRIPPRSDWGGPADYAIMLALVAGATLLGWLAQPLIGRGGTDLIYLLPVIAASGRFGLRLGVVTGLLSALAYNFFFLPPLYTFTVADPQSLLTLFVLLAIAMFTAELAGRLKGRANLGARSAHENAAIASFGQALARESDWAGTSRVVCDEMARILDVSVMLLNQRDGRLTMVASCPEAAAIGPVDQAAAEWSASRGEPAGVGTATLNAADWQFHPLKTALGVLAVVGLAREDGREPIGADRAVLLSTLLGQAALAHERLRLEDQLREVSMLKERDRLRTALLSSIGHDLRTPLTSVAGAIQAIGAEYPNAASLPLARAEVARLRRFLDNLMDMVRIDNDGLEPSPEPIDLTDAVGGAVHDLKDILRGRHIDLRVPANLPLVTTDATLLHHILINLLANAAQHGGDGPITIAGERTPGAVLLSIRDRGPGLPYDDANGAFETFVRGQGSDRRGGSGLGLAIVKGFADALGITVTADNDPDGGAVFTLRLALA
jgi:two-component system sensor histidine kinase KdpD